MSFTFSIYYTPLILAVLLSLLTFIYAWRVRELPEGKALLIMAFAAIWWGTFNICEYGFNHLDVKQFFAKIEYFGIETVPLAWLVFVALYTDQARWVKCRNLVLLAIIPVITVALMLTNEWHGLMRTNIALDFNGPFAIITKTYGPWFWVATAYNNLIMISGVYLIFRRLLRPPYAQSKQLFALLAIAMIPWAGNFLYILKVGAWTRVDYTSTFLSVSGVIMAFGLVRLQLLDIIPIGREFALENLTDGILVMDRRSRIVDYNRTTQQLFNLSSRVRVQPLASLPSEMLACLEKDESQNQQREFSLTNDPQQRVYELRVTPLYNQRQKYRGRVLHIQDITARKNAERERDHMITELREALEKVDTLSGFLPICSNCKKIRDDQGYWRDVELYISQHSKAVFSHGLCNDCLRKLYPETWERMKRKKEG